MTNKRVLTLLAALVGLVLVFLWLAGTFVGTVSDEYTERDRRAAEHTVAVTEASIPAWRHFSGALEARQSTNLSARITARVAETLVDAGDEVQAGDVLMRLESDDLSSRVRQREQALAAAQARVNEARASFDRTEAVVAQGLLPDAELDEARAARDSAEAQLEEAREALAEARTSESFSVIVAPFNGVISRRDAFTGDTASPGTALLSMYDPTSLRLEASVSESALAYLDMGAELQVKLPAQSQDLQATVEEIEPAADTASRSFMVRLKLPETDGFYPGMYGTLAVQTGTREVVLVPPGSVRQLGQLHYADVYRDDRVQRRLVRLGELVEHEGLLWQEIVAGLAPGEAIVPGSSE